MSEFYDNEFDTEDMRMNADDPVGRANDDYVFMCVNRNYYIRIANYIDALRARIAELEAERMPEDVMETAGDLCKLLKENLTPNTTNYNIYYLDVVTVENWLTAVRDARSAKGEK